MEERAQYGPWRERPRLTVVHDAGASYSALPHDIVFSDLTDGEVRMYAVVQSYAWGDEGECTASHATLAARTGKKERTIRALLASLVAKGYLIERHHGRGQGKAYRPCAPAQSGRNLPVESGKNLPVSEPKRQKSASQAANICQPKRQISAAPIEEDEVKKILEELPPTGVGVADATAPPAEPVKAKRDPRGTTCPETFPLEPKHYAYAAEHGYTDVARVAAITDAFLTHYRFTGKRGKDWYAGWQGWIRRQRGIDDERAARQTPHRNGRSDMPPPGAASKQTSQWVGSKFRVKQLGGSPDGR